MKGCLWTYMLLLVVAMTVDASSSQHQLSADRPWHWSVGKEPPLLRPFRPAALNQIQLPKMKGDFIWSNNWRCAQCRACVFFSHIGARSPTKGRIFITFLATAKVNLEQMNGNIIVAFSSHRKARSRMYVLEVGAWKNIKSVIRKTLGGPIVAEVLNERLPGSVCATNTSVHERYWFAVHNGAVSFGKGPVGQNVLLAWDDSEAMLDVRYAGLTSFDNCVQ